MLKTVSLSLTVEVRLICSYVIIDDVIIGPEVPLTFRFEIDGEGNWNYDDENRVLYSNDMLTSKIQEVKWPKREFGSFKSVTGYSESSARYHHKYIVIDIFYRFQLRDLAPNGLRFN